jgi:hypothetical protein
MFPILYLLCFLAATPQPALKTQKPRESCLERREACMNACVKQRETCDRENPTDAPRCVLQEKACESSCKVSMKRCYEDLERRAKSK